ncbi:MAG: hypothetical protein HC854_01825 [Flavobacterium sp.]|nr:hypothetical protein [Flavobacterium sp.]
MDDVCFRVADKQVSKILNNSKLVLSTYSGQNSYDRAEDFKSKGIVNEEKIFNQFIIKDGGNTEPKKFTSGKDKVISNYFLASIKGKIGYHFYYLSIVKGDHVLTLIIDNSNPCNQKFKTFDQTEIYSEKPFKEIDQEMLRLSNWIWNYMLKKTGKAHNTELAVWKIQR